MDLLIEPYSGRFNDKIVDLILGIQTKEFSIPITLEEQPDLLNIESFYQQGNGNFWIARIGERVVGTVALIDIGNHQVALRKMFVDPAFRGKEKGAAQRLLDELTSWARSHHVKEIILGTTAKYHAAHRFYEKNGFKLVEKSDLPASFPVMAVDSRFYRKLVQ